MNTIIHKSAAGIMVASLVALGACSGNDVEGGEIPLESGAAAEPSAAAQETVIARVKGSEGNSVEWIAPANEGEEPGIVIRVTYPNRALLDPGFMENHSALEAFLAVAPADAEVPAALLAHSREGAHGAARDAQSPEKRLALRRMNQEILDARPAFDANAPVNQIVKPGSSAGSNCDAGFIAWAATEYGNGYGDTATCGTSTGFTEHTFPTYYCTPGPNNDCAYPIGGLSNCYPAGDASCSAFQGNLLVHRASSVLGGCANFSYNMPGHRYRFSAANCESSGNVTMERKRGSGSWINTTVGPRSMQIRVDGAALPMASANPTLGVSYGFWKQLIPQSGASYLMNELDVSTGANQEAIVCADVYRKFETFDISAFGCNFNEEFCDPGDMCDGACW